MSDSGHQAAPDSRASSSRSVSPVVIPELLSQAARSALAQKTAITRPPLASFNPFEIIDVDEMDSPPKRARTPTTPFADLVDSPAKRAKLEKLTPRTPIFSSRKGAASQSAPSPARALSQGQGQGGPSGTPSASANGNGSGVESGSTTTDKTATVTDSELSSLSKSEEEDEDDSDNDSDELMDDDEGDAPEQEQAVEEAVEQAISGGSGSTAGSSKDKVGDESNAVEKEGPDDSTMGEVREADAPVGEGSGPATTAASKQVKVVQGQKPGTAVVGSPGVPATVKSEGKIKLVAKCGKAIEVDRAGLAFVSATIRKKVLANSSLDRYALKCSSAALSALLSLLAGDDIELSDKHIGIDLSSLLRKLSIPLAVRSLRLKCRELLRDMTVAGDIDSELVWMIMVVGAEHHDADLIRQAMRACTDNRPGEWEPHEAEQLGWRVYCAMVRAWDRSVNWRTAADALELSFA